jgi:hypothetical protein
MRSFWAIVNLTWKNAVRSHVFQLLLLVLLLCVACVPTTVRGGVAASDFIQISIFYTLSAISFILALSAVWIGCFVMTQDIEGYQLHMVVTKPVSRVKIWFAKWIGVSLVHLAMLAVTAAATYFIVLWNFDKQDFPKAELDKVRSEVMVGRRVYLPERPDYDAIAREALRRRVADLQQRGEAVDLSPEGQDKMFSEIKKAIISRSTELPFNQSRGWVYRGLPKNLDKPVFLRYRAYIEKVSTKNQRMTRGLWMLGVPRFRQNSNGVPQNNAAEKRDFDVYLYPLSQVPEQVMSGVFHEKTLDPKWGFITPQQEVYLQYVNADDTGSAQFFQEADGPKLLIGVTGFGANYTRAVIVIGIGITILAGLGCAFGGFMSLPTALFVVISYLLFGTISSYILGQTYISGLGDQMARFIANVLMKLIIPLQVFDMTNLVSKGELVEFSYIGKLLYFYFPRALVLYAFGIIMYRRRELGLIIRK